MRKRWNVMIVPNSPGRKIFSYDLSSRALLVGIAVAASLIVLSAVAAFYSTHKWKSDKLSQVSRLETELKERETEFSRLKSEFSVLEELEDKLRTIAGLKPRERSSGEAATAGGQGGRDQGEEEYFSAQSMSGGSSRHSVHATPSELLEDSIVLRDSFEEVLDVFERERERLACVPSINPVDSQEAWISSGFGYRVDPISGERRFHEGCDIVAPNRTPVIAPAAGVVQFAGWREGLGRTILIDHGYGYKTTYSHNSKLLVKKGDEVKRGDVIAHVGSSGRSTGPHLHYEVYLNDNLVNPYQYVVQ